MHVVIAPDAFAGTLTALEAAAAIEAGWRRGAPHDTVTTIPLSDGGPGFVDVLAAALPEATLIPVTVDDPFARPTPGTLLVHADPVHGLTVYVESAQACGLHLVPAAERDLARASTTGVGQLLRAALQATPKRVVVGLGGSGTHDGGRGAVTELGTAWPAGVELLVATDVDARYDEASYFAPQKGATPEQIPALDHALAGWANELEAATGRKKRTAEGGGAAGGLGFGLLCLGGTRVPGIGLVADVVDLRGILSKADLVVTGEGGYDAMSLRGKVCGGVARLSQQAGRACIIMAGTVTIGSREARAHGIDELRSAAELAGSVEESLGRPAYWLTELAARTAPQWSRAPSGADPQPST